MSAADKIGNEKMEIGSAPGIFKQYKPANQDIDKDIRDRLRELRRANAKYTALVNMSHDDIEEAAHDR